MRSKLRRQCDARALDDSSQMPPAVAARESWIWALGRRESTPTSSGFDADDAQGRRRREGTSTALKATSSTVEKMKLNVEMRTPTRRAIRDGGRTTTTTGRMMPMPPMRRVRFGAHLGGYDDDEEESEDWRSASSEESEPPTPSSRPPPRAYVRANEAKDDDARDARWMRRRDGSSSSVATASTTVKLRALTKEAALFRDESRRERKRREAAEEREERLRSELASVKREYVALKFSHDKLKTANEEADEESKRRTRALKKKLAATLERESRQRRRSVAALRAALNALRTFAPTAPSGRALGGSAVSVVIDEISKLTETIALRDALVDDEIDDAPADHAIPSSWTVSEMERAKARLEILERELEDAHEIIRASEKERVALERELAATRRELESETERYHEDIRAATEATTRAIDMVRERNEIDAAAVAADDDTGGPTTPPSPRDSPPPSPSARDLRADMDVLQLELSRLQDTMRQALAEVDGRVTA